MKQVLESDQESVSKHPRQKYHASSSMASRPVQLDIQSEFERNQLYLDQKSLHSLAGEVVKSTIKSDEEGDCKAVLKKVHGIKHSNSSNDVLNDPRR